MVGHRRRYAVSAFLNSTDVHRMRHSIDMLMVGEPQWSSACWHTWTSNCGAAIRHRSEQDEGLHHLEAAYSILENTPPANYSD